MSNVLIIDDSRTMRSIIKRGLKQADLGIDSFVEAEDGLIGLDALQNQNVDLILANISMASMSSQDFVRQVRENHGPSTPIIMISGPRDDVPGTEMSIDGVLEKPFTALQLSQILEKLIP